MPTMTPSPDPLLQSYRCSSGVLRVGLVGESADVDFCQLREDLERRLVDQPSENINIVLCSLQDRAEEVCNRQPIDLLIVWQGWPDQFTHRDVLATMTQFPLSRVMVVFGPWCQSDGRTRNFWPVAVRVSREDCWRRVQQEIEVIRGLRPPLEPTASRSETFGWSIGASGL